MHSEWSSDDNSSPYLKLYWPCTVFLVASFERCCARPGPSWRSFRTVIFIPFCFLWAMEEKGARGKETCLHLKCKTVTTVTVGGGRMQWITTPASLSSTSFMTGREQMALLQKHCLIPRARQLNRMRQRLANAAAGAHTNSTGKLPAHPFERQVGIVLQPLFWAVSVLAIEKCLFLFYNSPARTPEVVITRVSIIIFISVLLKATQDKLPEVWTLIIVEQTQGHLCWGKPFSTASWDMLQ